MERKRKYEDMIPKNLMYSSARGVGIAVSRIAASMNIYFSRGVSHEEVNDDITANVLTIRIVIMMCQVPIRSHHSCSCTSHAMYHANKLVKTLGPRKDIVINMSGRGDKDMPQMARIKGVGF